MKTFILFAVLVAGAAAESALLLPNASPFLHLPNERLEQLSDEDVATVLARVLDLPSDATPETKELPSGNIFQRPSSVVLLSVDSLDFSEAQRLGLENLSMGVDFPLEARAGVSADAMVGAVPARLSKHFDDNSLVLCASGSSAVATACSGPTHTALVPGLNVQIDVSAVMESESSLWAQFNTEGSIRTDGREFTASTAAGVSATFNLDRDVDRSFFAEIALFSELPNLLKSFPGPAGRLADDGAPSLSLLAVSSLSELDGARFEVAAALLDSAIVEVKRILMDARAGETVWMTALRADGSDATMNTSDSGVRKLLMTGEAPQHGRRLAPAPLNGVEAMAWETEWQTFQIQLWTFLGLALAGYWASYSLFNVSYGHDDSGLFSKFKPDGSNMDLM